MNPSSFSGWAELDEADRHEEEKINASGSFRLRWLDEAERSRKKHKNMKERIYEVEDSIRKEKGKEWKMEDASEGFR